MRTGDGRVDEMARDGMGWVWQAGRPVSVSVSCACVTVSPVEPPRCWSRRACQSGMLWLASCQTGNLVMVVTTAHQGLDGQPSRASVLLLI